jgi:hypothetical protein
VALSRIVTLAAAAGVAASLAGCATPPLTAPPPFSVEEQLWFDKATGPDLTKAPPGLRYQPPPGYIYPGALPPPPPGYR